MNHRPCLRRLFILCVSLMGGGCGFAGWWSTRNTSLRSPDASARSFHANSPSAVIGAPKSSTGGAIRVVDLAFDVLRADLPVGTVRHSRKIWNHVDELRIDPSLVARLARNGLRVGAASVGSWPAIRAVFEAAGARLAKNLAVVQRGVPLSIKLSTLREAESIFSYDLDTRLIGKTFSAGDKVLNLDYVFHPELGRCTDVQLRFEIRRDRNEMSWVRQNGTIRQVPALDRHVFDGLTVLVTLQPEEFLVIGPSEEATNEYLVGSRFLSDSREGAQYETVLCITPKPFHLRNELRRPL